MAGAKDGFGAVCGIAEDGHPQMWIAGRLTAEMNSAVNVQPGSGVQVEGPATVYRPNAMAGTLEIDTKSNTCVADQVKGAMWGMSEQKAPFIGNLPKPGGR